MGYTEYANSFIFQPLNFDFREKMIEEAFYEKSKNTLDYAGFFRNHLNANNANKYKNRKQQFEGFSPRNHIVVLPGSNKIKERMVNIVEHTTKMNGCSGQISFNKDKPEYPVLINHKKQTDKVIDVAKKHSIPVNSKGLPVLGAEDFAFYLHNVPGCFYFLGNGLDVSCHNDTYDFNDELIETGVNMWVNLVKN